MNRAEQVAARVWDNMLEMYGSEWSFKFGSTPTQGWIDMLGDFDVELISRALKQCLTSHNKPPTMPEFRSLIKSQLPTTQEYMASLPPPKVYTEEEVKRAHETLKKAAPKTSGGKRSILLPGECLEDFKKAMAESGKSEAEFRRERLAMNGWTDEMEQTFLSHLSTVGKYAQLGPSY
jgi:hypothetical protein